VRREAHSLTPAPPSRTPTDPIPEPSPSGGGRKTFGLLYRLDPDTAHQDRPCISQWLNTLLLPGTDSRDRAHGIPTLNVGMLGFGVPEFENPEVSAFSHTPPGMPLAIVFSSASFLSRFTIGHNVLAPVFLSLA